MPTRRTNAPAEPMLPQDLEAEQAALGSIMLEPTAAALALGMLEPRDFSPEHHQRIFRAMQMAAQRGPVDLITVTHELRRQGRLEGEDGVGGAEYLAALINTVPTAAHVERYAKLVAEKSGLRKLGQAGADLQAAAGRPDANIEDLLREAREKLAAIADCTGEADETRGLDVVASRLAATCWLWPGRLPCGYLSVLAGETGAGKSTTGLHLVGAALGQWPWPDGTAPAIISERVVWAETEARQGMLAQRATAWGLPLERIVLPGADGLGEVDLGARNTAAQLGRQAEKAAARLVVVDSLSGAHGIDENSSAMRLLLKELALVARDQCVAILLLHHARKRQMGEGPELTLDRLRGSSTLPQFAVSILGQDCPAGEAEGAPRRRRSLKLNLGALPPALGVTLSDGFPLFSADAPGAPRRDQGQATAEEFLRAALRRRPSRCSDLLRDGQEQGISKDALYRARKALGIVTAPDSEHPRGRFWSLPADGQRDPLGGRE